MSHVSTWMGDRLGIHGAVDIFAKEKKLEDTYLIVVDLNVRLCVYCYQHMRLCSLLCFD